VSDPFKIDGPALISFSGGRTSGYMLWRIIQAHGGTLPDDVRVTFSNTGREMPETLNFVRDCGEQFGVDIVWLEYRWREDGSHSFDRVDHQTASRNGEPFDQLIMARSMLPNPVMRFCTQELKIRVMGKFARSLGWSRWANVIGLRADEPARVARMRAPKKDRYEPAMPLATAGITRVDVSSFWASRNFDLRLPNVNGKTALGNCDLCFLKSAATISGIMRIAPHLADWWIKMESTSPGLNKARDAAVAYFRKDRPSYAQMLAAVQANGPGFDFGTADELNDCYCTGDA
jgi:3'-phosphoadenosine 5'-phosphosulfate sulfotransferase (PAPS reductase)/FAD synthetase